MEEYVIWECQDCLERDLTYVNFMTKSFFGFMSKEQDGTFVKECPHCKGKMTQLPDEE